MLTQKEIVKKNAKRFDKAVGSLESQLENYGRVYGKSCIQCRRIRQEIRDLKKRLVFVNKHGYKF